MKNCQSRKRWEVPRVLQCCLQLTARWLNGHPLHLHCGWSDKGHTCPFLELRNVSQDCCEALKWQNGAKPFPALLFYGVIALVVFKARNKNLPGQAPPCQEPESWQDLGAWQGQSAIHVHWAWRNIWQTKICRIQSSTEHPTKRDLLWCSSGCCTGGGQFTAHLLLNGKRGVMKKNLLACFLKRWEEENQLSFWKGRRASTPIPTPAGLPGKGEVVFGWLCRGWCCFGKKLAFFWMPPARSGRANIQKGLLPVNDIQLLHTKTLQFCFCTAYPHFMQGKRKWHVSIIPTESRTPNTLSPKKSLLCFVRKCLIPDNSFFLQWST